MLLLQTSFALPFYDVVPGTDLIQFTFRLLGFVDIGLALCAAMVLDQVRARAGFRICAALCGVLALAVSIGKPWLGHAPSPFFSDVSINAALRSEEGAKEPTEYLPSPPDITLRSAAAVQAPTTKAGVCRATPLDDMTIERATARFAADCGAVGTVRLPIFLAPGMVFTVQGRTLAAFRACPEAMAQLSVAGPAVITVTYPTFWRALRVAAGLLVGRKDPAFACTASRDRAARS